MDARPNPLARTIVVGADGSEGSDRAVAWAAREAVTIGAGLRIVSAWSLPSLMWPATMGFASIDPADLRAGAVEILDRAREVALVAIGSLQLDIQTVEAHGGAVELLLARSKGAAMLVVGTRGRGGFASLLLGSVATSCAHHATVPLVVIGVDAPPPGDGEVVVGVDDSLGGRTALRWAAVEATRVGATLRVVHAWEVPVAPGPEVPAIVWDPDLEEAARQHVVRVVDEEVDVVGERPVVEVVGVLRSVAEELIDGSKGAAMLVVGSRGRGGFRELLLGSVSQHCLHHATCPVVVVPSSDPATAVTTP